MRRLSTVYRFLRQKEYVVPILLSILAATLRFYRLGADSLWMDEGYSLHDAADFHYIPKSRPFYYVLLHLWMSLGHSEVWLRLLSVLFGIGCVVMLYLLTKQLFGRRIGFFASLLMAISPLHINHSQEIRMYSVAVFFVLVEMYYFLQFIKSRSTKHLAACTASSIVAGLTHPLTLFMLPAVGLFLGFTHRDFRTAAMRWTSVQAVLGLLCIPVAAHSLHDFGGKWTWALEKPGLLSVMAIMRDFTILLIPRQFPKHVLVGELCGILVMALICLGVLVAHRHNRWQVTLIASWLAVPIALTLLVSRYIDNIWIARYMLYASPACYILVALGINGIESKVARRLLSVGILILVSAGVGTYYSQPHNPEWRNVAAYIEDRLKDGDSIDVYTYGNIHAFAFYYRGKAPFVGLGQKRLSREAVTGLTDSRISAMLSDTPGSRRTWFALQSSMNLGEVEIEAYVRKHFRVLDTQHFSRIDVLLAVPVKK